MRITADAAKSIANESGSPQDELSRVCDQIRICAEGGCFSVEWNSSELDMRTVEWLELNGFDVWERRRYASITYLITWK